MQRYPVRCRLWFRPAVAGSSPSTCRVTLEQEVHPKGLPPIFFNGFRAMAAMQVR